MADKLFLDVAGDDLKVFRIEAEVFKQAAEKFVGHKIGLGGTEYDVLEDEVFREENGYRDDQDTDGSANEMPAQFFDMLEETHFVGILFRSCSHAERWWSEVGGEYREVNGIPSISPGHLQIITGEPDIPIFAGTVAAFLADVVSGRTRKRHYERI